MEGKGKRTSSAVQVSEVQDIGGTALGGGARADNCLALLDLDGSSESQSGEEGGEDGGEKHDDGWLVGLVGGSGSGLVVNW
jgi:hypothetical protein